MAIGRVPGATGIQPSIVDAKGDLIAATAADSVSRLAVGTNNQVLTADSAEATGLKYANGSRATLTTTGDILYASAANTPARLGIGSTSQVLTVSGGIPAWGASGLTLIKTASFSAVADTGTTFDGVFTSTYDNYVIQIIDLISTSATADPHLQVRYAGPTTQAASYYSRYADTDGTVWSFAVSNNSAHILLADKVGDLSGYGSNFNIQCYRILSGGSRPAFSWTGLNGYDTSMIGAGYSSVSRIYTGFLLKASAGNITGTVSVYGLAK